MTRFKIDSMSAGYPLICNTVAADGESVSPRGEPTRELLDVVIELTDPTQSLPYECGRDLLPAIGAVEALQLVSGTSFPELACRIAPTMRRFLNGGTFHGAYGPRTRAQTPVAIEKLRRDPDTRQAVITVWDPTHDSQSEMRDYPCTVMLQFLLRGGALQLHVTMRSNDVWWGLAYDVFQFTQMQLAVANVLEVTAGHYFHHAVSMHAYERDVDRIEQLHAAPPNHKYIVDGLGQGCTEWGEVRADAEAILDGTLQPDPIELPVERWHWDQLEKYREARRPELGE